MNDRSAVESGGIWPAQGLAEASRVRTVRCQTFHPQRGVGTPHEPKDHDSIAHTMSDISHVNGLGLGSRAVKTDDIEYW